VAGDFARDMERHPIVDHRADSSMTKVVNVKVWQASRNAGGFPGTLEVVEGLARSGVRQQPLT
tara:strand:- start:65 stop:253 length:189 start_codon:yes stop_codon:yes gene_type:complete